MSSLEGSDLEDASFYSAKESQPGISDVEFRTSQDRDETMRPTQSATSSDTDTTPIVRPDGKIINYPGKLSNAEIAMVRLDMEKAAGKTWEPYDIEEAMRERRQEEFVAQLRLEVEEEKKKKVAKTDAPKRSDDSQDVLRKAREDLRKKIGKNGDRGRDKKEDDSGRVA